MLITPNAVTTCPDGPDGLITAAWVSPDFDLTWDVGITDEETKMIREFLDGMKRISSVEFARGTFFAVRSHEESTPGEWHSDSGGGIRFVGAVSNSLTYVGQEFEILSRPLASGHIAAYTDEVHRRPRTFAGLRIFLSATMYWEGETPDLSCPRLESLR